MIKSRYECQNNPKLCAERTAIENLIKQAKKKGVRDYKICSWINRYHGEINIERIRGDGIIGTSLPCILCKQKMDKMNLRWKAYYEDHWVTSTDDNLPESTLTSRQANVIFKHPKIKLNN